MRIHNHPLRLLSALLVSACLAVPSAQAASIFIDAANLEDRVAFNFGQFEGGFSINGSTPITTGGAVFGEDVQLNFTGRWIDLGAAVAFSRTVYWVSHKEPTLISEILQWTVTPSSPGSMATISGFFIADSGGTLPINTNPADIIIEVPSGAHDPFNFSAAFLGGQVITGAELPEPATWLMFSMGLLGVIAGWRRRRGVA